MGLEQIIKEKLEAQFKPDLLIVDNESHKHIGHAGDDGSGESHFKITISSDTFQGKSRLQTHREINQCLDYEMKNHIHALSINVI
ncbi:MAG: BolA family transcriptional regulator [Micavibrio sp.]|nr:BolA family transcriptional regulator [Micavibrio sp.]|tara:strand:- start:2646 stop:2900 length:255 start_codon:yes stop_codon:yes gene_type:complete